MPALYNEVEPYAAAWLRNLIGFGELPDGVVDGRSIVDVRGDDLAGCDELHFFAGVGVWARAVAEAEEVTGHRLARPLFTGSCPCQPLSVAGRQQGHADQRHLWPAFHHLIAERRPATILGEQVAGKDGREWMAAVRHDLEASGYAVGTAILPAGGYGAPHIRYRMFWMADANQVQRGRRVRDERVVNRASGERVEGDGQPARSGEVRGVADAEGMRGRGWQPNSDHDQGPADSREGWMVHNGTDARDRPGPADSFWSDADWIFCRDNKWRPIEPGSFPLVDGSAFRLGSGGPYEGMSRAGMLRGYGNALVLPVARAFVECAMEALDGH